MTSTLVPNANICLTFDSSISQLLAKFAKKYFADIADGYLLGPQSLAHITLCQIYHDKPLPRALRRALGSIMAPPEATALNTLIQRPGTKTHDGYTWLEYSLEPTPEWLDELKAQVEIILSNYDVTILTPTGPDYHPHVTLCRFKGEEKTIVTDALKFKTSIDANQMALSLGASDAQGQLPKIYWTKVFT